jgi:hypothetical protein
LTGDVSGIAVGAILATGLCCFYNRRKNLKLRNGRQSELEELEKTEKSFLETLLIY